LSYWRQQLAGAPTSQLFSNKSTPATTAIHQGEYESFVLSTDLTDKLKELSRREGATLFMTLLAAFQVLLTYYTDQDDIVIGTDIANRNRTETEALIGFFVNQLTLRLNLSGNPDFTELLARARQMVLDAYTHQDLPFEKLVEAINPDRKFSRTPLFQTKLVLQNAPVPTMNVSGLSLQRFQLQEVRELAKFDLLVTLTETDEGLRGAIEYSLAVFERREIEGLIRLYEAVLSNIVERPETSLEELRAMLKMIDSEQELVEYRELKEASLQIFKKARQKVPDQAPQSMEAQL
jgi:Non-ribosomal peptide synthetase modules and related proteins